MQRRGGLIGLAVICAVSMGAAWAVSNQVFVKPSEYTIARQDREITMRGDVIQQQERIIANKAGTISDLKARIAQLESGRCGPPAPRPGDGRR